MIKNAFFALVFLLLINAASALIIDAPVEIPTNVNWVAAVQFDSTGEFDTAQVFLDGVLMASVYTLPNGSGIVDSTNGNYVLKAFLVDEDNDSLDGLVLNVSFFGLSSGSHAVTARTFKNLGLVSESEANIYVFDALSTEYKAQMDAELENLRTLNQTLDEKIAEIETGVASLNTLVEEKSSDFDAINTVVAELRISLTELQETLDEQGMADLQIYERIGAINESLSNFGTSFAGAPSVPFAEETDGSVPENFDSELLNTGSVTLADTGSLPMFLGILIVAAFVIVALYFRGKGGDSIYSKDDGMFRRGRAEEDALEKVIGDEIEAQQGKWATEGTVREKPEKETKFGMGDLIKK